ncbi:MAG: DUF5050 domain-containing protein [Bacteroidales bacterium]|jgi:hypothetical protein|nr:DUF5050 domain-containing protein [Bacteroidales bacterium]
MKTLSILLFLFGMMVFQTNAQVTTLASNLDSPWSVCTDGSFVYWVEGNMSTGAVKKVSVNGGDVTTLASGLPEPRAIAVDASSVYWIERNNGSNGSLKKVPVNGGDVTTLVTGLRNAQNHMALDANNIYWGDGKAGGGGEIKKVSKNGGTVTSLVSTGILNLKTAIAVDETFVYFYDDLNHIKTVPVNGGAVTTIGTGTPEAYALYGSDIYWIEYGSGTVKKMPKSGGTVTTLATGSNSPSNLAVDGTSVFWIEFNNPGRVMKVPVGGGTSTIVSNEANTIGVAVDNTNVYWAVSVYINQGKIQKAPSGGSPAFNLSGTITYPNVSQSPLEGITINLKNAGGTVIATTTTNVSGNYSFPNLTNGNYTLEPSTSKPWGGVTALDVLLFKKHIANIAFLEGIFLASGDVNGSGGLTAADVLLIKKRIAFVTNSFIVGDWLFNNTPIVINGGNVVQNFNGLCYGDANGSYNPTAKGY